MTDIVERLRNRSPYLHGSSAERTMADAADEIGRQQADIDKLMSERDGWLQEIELQRTTIADTMSDLGKAEVEVERLKADNKRLRLELRDVIIQRDALMREPKP